MLLMESYMFCASVRLGVIIISAFAMAKSVIIIFVIGTQGIGFMLTIIAAYDVNLSYRTSYYLVRDAIIWMEKYPKTITILLQLYSVGHVLSCFVASYGAYVLKKNFVIPLAIFEFLYIVEIATLATLFLRILRHFLYLHQLALLTILATFYIILVTYDFFALVAFEQIVRLVKSARYQEYYGDDPFNPILIRRISAVEELHPKLIFVAPKLDLKVHPKWWQVANDATEMDTMKNAGKYFQSHELLPDVMLHNTNNIGYMKKYRF